LLPLAGEQIFAAAELNESRHDRTGAASESGDHARGWSVHSCPAFAGATTKSWGRFCYVNAGHTPGLLRDDAGWSNCTDGAAAGVFSLAPTDARIVGLGANGSLRWFRAGCGGGVEGRGVWLEGVKG